MNNAMNFNTDRGLTLTIDTEKELKIYPNDMNFVERFSNMYSDAKKIMLDHQKKAAELSKEVDDDGVYVNTDALIKLTKKTYQDIYSMLDELLDAKVTQMVFTDQDGELVYDDEYLFKFLDFIQGHIANNRKSNIQKYGNRQQRRAAARNSI